WPVATGARREKPRQARAPRGYHFEGAARQLRWRSRRTEPAGPKASQVGGGPPLARPARDPYQTGHRQEYQHSRAIGYSRHRFAGTALASTAGARRVARTRSDNVLLLS